MQGENDLPCISIHIHNDLMEQGSQDAFLQTNIRLRTAPHRLQFGCQILKLFPCVWGANIPVSMDMLLDSKLDLSHSLQGLIPATF
jgi:hypothetical protein